MTTQQIAAAPPPGGAQAGVPTLDLARSQVRALLMASPAFGELPRDTRRRLAHDLVKVASYTADLADDVWRYSEQLGQRPVLHHREVTTMPVVQALAARDEFAPVAVGQVARITGETLKAVSFPTFVADILNGTFDAIVTSNIRQMEAYGKLLENVCSTVDDFMNSNITDNQARDWLAESYPEYIKRTQQGDRITIEPAEGADERPRPDWRQKLNLQGDVSLDESDMEEVLVPAARRRLAEMRLQLLSTMVLLGINRIVVTGGKIRATMGFHIDASDRAHTANASDFDLRHSHSGSFGYGPWSVSAQTSIAYVSSSRADSDAEINVSTDLTGEVEVHFKGDYFPIERFATSGMLNMIRGNTAVPDANAPVITQTDAVPWGSTVTTPQVNRSASSRPLPNVDTRLQGVTEVARQPAPVQQPVVQQQRPPQQPPVQPPAAAVAQPAAGTPPAAVQLPAAGQAPPVQPPAAAVVRPAAGTQPAAIQPPGAGQAPAAVQQPVTTQPPGSAGVPSVPPQIEQAATGAVAGVIGAVGSAAGPALGGIINQVAGGAGTALRDVVTGAITGGGGAQGAPVKPQALDDETTPGAAP